MSKVLLKTETLSFDIKMLKCVLKGDGGKVNQFWHSGIFESFNIQLSVYLGNFFSLLAQWKWLTFSILAQLRSK